MRIYQRNELVDCIGSSIDIQANYSEANNELFMQRSVTEIMSKGRRVNAIQEDSM